MFTLPLLLYSMNCRGKYQRKQCKQNNRVSCPSRGLFAEYPDLVSSE
jgi:hypothetical protein